MKTINGLMPPYYSGLDEKEKVILMQDNTQDLKFELLSESRHVEDFDCGQSAQDTWLRTRAFSNQRSDDTRTYVALQGAEIAGFYVLAVSSIVRANLPGALRRNAADPVSCVLLAQMAVASRFQSQGLGRKLMLQGMAQAARIAEIASCRLFAVHPARPDLVAYYEKAGFVPVDASPALMVMSLRTVRHLLEAVADV